MQKRDYEFKLESSLVQLIVISADPEKKKKSERLLVTVNFKPNRDVSKAVHKAWRASFNLEQLCC